MKKSYFLMTIILILTIVTELSAQTHVTDLTAEKRNNLVRLTWTDSPEATGSVYIFRSLRAFGRALPPNMRPIIIDYGQQFYIDDIEDIENVYYFVAASDMAGNRFEAIIPQVNAVSLNMNFPIQVFEEEAEQITAAASIYDEPSHVQEQVTDQISDLNVVQHGDKVIITFSSGDENRNSILYRSMQPVRRPHDLLSAIIVQTHVSSPHIDYPVPGINWFYTVVYEDEITGGNITIMPGVNATNEAVLISPLLADQVMRPVPLPVLTMRDTRIENFFPRENIQRLDLSDEISGLLRAIQLPQRPPLELKPLRIFAIDLQGSQDREESALSRIIIEHFALSDFEGARISLLQFLSFPRSNELEIRARFYLAQSLYFLENYREALVEFLSIRAYYPGEINSWIDAVLEAMIRQ